MTAATPVLDLPTREATIELLTAMADDEFVIGFWDSEWTGIAPMLEEDVAMSSIAQDEIGHAKALYELAASLADADADQLAFGRQPEEYRHAALMNHPRTDWAFTIARRYLYDSADAVRLESLATSAFEPLAGLATKMRREESYHLMHMSAWIRRLAEGSGSRERLVTALARLWPDAQTVFTPLADEASLLKPRILPDSLEELRGRWLERAIPPLEALNLPVPSAEERRARPAADGRTRLTGDFSWLWREFTMVYRSEEGAEW
jgi:ring-1,2-phenylacetyl-CoA epoxidase subunit PaaC